MLDSLRPPGLSPAKLLCPWDSPRMNTGMGCHVLLQGIVSTKGLNPRLLFVRQLLGGACVCVFFFFLMWTILKIFIEFVIILLLFYTLDFWPRGMCDLSSPTRGQTHTPCTGRWSCNHWTDRESPSWVLLALVQSACGLSVVACVLSFMSRCSRLLLYIFSPDQQSVTSPHSHDF